jgi:hypothetical protein
MNGAWIQAGGFENVLPFIILVLWIVGKVMNARAEARSREKPPGDAGPRPARGKAPPAVPPAGSGEERLRRFLAELTGVEPPPPAEVEPPDYEAPAPLPALPPLPEPRRPQAFRPVMQTTAPDPSAAPDPFSLRRSLAERHRRRRARPAAPPPIPIPAPAMVQPARVEASAPAEIVMRFGPQARTAVMPASSMQGITMAGPHMGSFGRLSSAGRAYASWNIHPLLGSRRRLKEAMILRTLLAPPRAFEPI